MKRVVIEVVIEQKDAMLSAFVVVPAAAVAGWKLAGTTTVEASLDGKSIGRRSLKRWDAQRWFVELRRDHLVALGVTAGSRARLSLSLASPELPAELSSVIAADRNARARWQALSAAQQRMIREEIVAAKSSLTRERRARRALCPPASPPPPPVAGLTPAPLPLQVRIVARRLPGSNCGPYTGVRVGLVEKVGCDPAARVDADQSQAVWETRVEVRATERGPTFRGPAVNGPPDGRFLYLTWTGRLGHAPPAHEGMFRRAKIRLDAVPPAVLSKALSSGLLVGRLVLTAKDGMPVCGSVRPPSIVWSAARAHARRSAGEGKA